MKIMVFTEGTIIMHRGGIGRTAEERSIQVKEKGKSIYDWASYVPINRAVEKLKTWKERGAVIVYLTSRRSLGEVELIKGVLKKYDFPEGHLMFRHTGQTYGDVTESAIPDILIEDDCASIGGLDEMTISQVKPEIKAKIISIPVKEFGGIDHLPDELTELIKLRNI